MDGRVSVVGVGESVRGAGGLRWWSVEEQTPHYGGRQKEQEGKRGERLRSEREEEPPQVSTVVQVDLPPGSEAKEGVGSVSRERTSVERPRAPTPCVKDGVLGPV